ncbi:hypothetical protein [Magnetofaba australis]|nr:hypothetical protein [Magnetofaba australis]
MDVILWIAWGSAIIIPIKVFLLVRWLKKKVREDVPATQSVASEE